MDACRECVEARTALAEEFRRLRPLFVALGDENRQRVFLALLEADQVGLRAEEIAKRTNLSRPAVSRHLRTLRAAGAVAARTQRPAPTAWAVLWEAATTAFPRRQPGGRWT